MKKKKALTTESDYRAKCSRDLRHETENPCHFTFILTTAWEHPPPPQFFFSRVTVLLQLVYQPLVIIINHYFYYGDQGLRELLCNTE